MRSIYDAQTWRNHTPHAVSRSLLSQLRVRCGNMRSKIGVNRQTLSRVTDRCKVSDACYLYNFHLVANISMLCSQGQLRLVIGAVATTADNYCRKGMYCFVMYV